MERFLFKRKKGGEILKFTLYYTINGDEIAEFENIEDARRYCRLYEYNNDEKYALVFEPKHGIWRWWYNVIKPAKPILELMQ